MKRFLLAITLATGFAAQAQTGAYNEQAEAYIRKYKELAMEEQRRSGVPAAITLAQGIHETQAGTSELATEANNHFGIKCKKTWQGETFAHTDDAPNECFRKYSKVIDSYRDHSDYLRNSTRYQSCFALDVTDYAGWAAELKKCGYATNPRYAAKLTRIVEDFHLQDYTYAALGRQSRESSAPVYADAGEQQPVAARTREEVAMDARREEVQRQPEVVPEQDAPIDREAVKAAPVAEPAAPIVTEEPAPENTEPVYGQTVQRNGLKGFYAHKGDVLLEYAIKYNMRYARLLELNDLPDAPLAADMFVYLEKKRSTALRSTHKVTEGETMAQIAQAEGVQLKQLRTLNQMEQDEEPVAGSTLQLQTMAAAKPGVTVGVRTAQPAYHHREDSEQETIAVLREDRVPLHDRRTAAPMIQEGQKEEPVTVAPPIRKQPEAAKAPIEEETEEEEAPAASRLPAVVERKTVPPPAPVVVAENPPAPVIRKEEVKKEPVAPRPQPVATQPARTIARQKTYTIADEVAVEEIGKTNTYSPRYRAQPATTAATSTDEMPAVKETEPAATAKEEAPQEPQDEFSRLKAKLDKAVYAPSSPKPVQAATPVPAQPQPKAAAPVVTASDGPAYHTVKAGDTAFGIAKQYDISMKQLMDMNHLNFEAIKVGQKLRVK